MRSAECEASTRIRIFLKQHTFFYTNRPQFRPHETSEPEHRYRIFLKQRLRPRPHETG